MKTKTSNNFYLFIVFAALFLLTLTACGSEQAEPVSVDGKLRVVATTTFVGDVVGEIARDAIDLTVMLSPGENPHAFEPTPQDIVAVAEADVVFANGLDLEEFLADLIQNAGGDAELVYVSEGIDVRYFDAGHEHDDEEDLEGEDDHESVDPHVWFDLNNIIVWTENIETALSRLDPEQAATYQANAEAYKAELESLDSWIRQEVAQIPAENRQLVSDHTSFGYFADEYDFELIGAVIEAPTTEAEPSGQQLAQLHDAIKEHNVEAIFVGADFDPTLSERVAEDTGVQLVALYFGSLTPKGGEADTYLDFMRYNVQAILEALK
ncbi:MAG: Manganese-binding lipoprotein MntA [Chloroflexi bacterium]|nr:Manganese-binding lipoprotein MntA [Chloroflexota bacterium]